MFVKKNPGQKSQVSSAPPPSPADPPAPGAPSPDPKAKPSAAAPADKPKSHHKAKPEAKHKGPGRPRGAPNKPKANAGEVARKKRIAGDEVKDTRKYLIALQSDAEKASARHNALHPGDPFTVKLVRGVGPEPQMSPEECQALAVMAADWLGKKWDVQTRPTKPAIENWGVAASKASAYLPAIPPMYMAIGGLVLATWIAFGPMLDEKNARARGATPPAPPPPPAKEGA